MHEARWSRAHQDIEGDKALHAPRTQVRHDLSQLAVLKVGRPGPRVEAVGQAKVLRSRLRRQPSAMQAGSVKLEYTSHDSEQCQLAESSDGLCQPRQEPRLRQNMHWAFCCRCGLRVCVSFEPHLQLGAGANRQPATAPQASSACASAAPRLQVRRALPRRSQALSLRLRTRDTESAISAYRTAAGQRRLSANLPHSYDHYSKANLHSIRLASGGMFCSPQSGHTPAVPYFAPHTASLREPCLPCV